jgi:hypothetical protein
MVPECMGTCYILFVGGSTCLGSYGPVRGMRNHVDSAKHMADMGRHS